MYVHLTYDRGQSTEDRTEFSALVTHRRKVKLDPIIHKVNSKWIKDIPIKTKTTNFSENNTVKYFHDFRLEGCFK